jgi:ABC-type bacteriocin/lantibiotic exporter with double-glycine peptidase domain
LISGFLEPSEGQISVDSIKIIDNVENWQNLISYVPQNIFFIDGTVKENICLGLEENEIDYESLENAIKLSKSDEFINKLDMGINHPVGEGGKNLSYGQSQRVALARSLYKKPKLLILDETTSGLDLEIEETIIKQLIDLKKYLTIIIVSHKKETLKYCDKILNIEEN